MKDYSNQKTIYEMKDIIKRCFEECEKAGHIKKAKRAQGSHGENRTVDVKFEEETILVNPEEVASHISKTLIGELMEFEILRRMGPAFRSMRSVENDLEFLFRKQQQEISVGNLRIGEK